MTDHASPVPRDHDLRTCSGSLHPASAFRDGLTGLSTSPIFPDQKALLRFRSTPWTALNEGPRLGITAEIPQQYGRSRLVDEATGVGFLAFGPKQSLTLRHGGLALSVDQLNRARELVPTGEPPAAEALLADARFLAGGADTVDAQRAVLMAAIACEVKAKRVVIERANPERRQGLGGVSNLDEITDRFYQQAFGVSLRLSNQALFIKAKRLRTLRNKIAHEGEAVDRDECDQLVLAATQIFAWLNAIQPTP
ncbi:hypothetical protein QQG74_03415 [Micromonospora sp. FIMYZ51]|uniref:hypothetical protein n=1 Tax=Micromonospora sp. FIMYZ51 TaxID=3051832 RepID=UPI00311D6CB3